MSAFDVAIAVADLRSITDFTELRTILADATTSLGFTYFAMIQSNSSRTDTGGIVVLNYPTRYMQYQAETFGYRNSPILLVARSLCAPFLWSDLPGLMTLTQEHIDYLREAADYGLNEGFTVPIHVPGEPSGFVSFVSNKEKTIDRRVLPDAFFIASHAFSAGRRIRTEMIRHRRGDTLEIDDRRIIMLIARGKSRWAIARKLSLSEQSVSESLLRTRRYYRVGSQTQAVVHALYDQTIGFEDIIG